MKTPEVGFDPDSQDAVTVEVQKKVEVQPLRTTLLNRAWKPR